MRILLWHGYLLTGSGSNVYAANTAREWRKAGHHVLVLCQDRAASDLPFVDDAFDLGSRMPDRDGGGGRCDVARPDIAGLLPVYVYDHYEGFEVKRFVDLTDEELHRYTELNVGAMVEAIEHFEPEAIVTGHEVMGPAIAQRACSETGTTYIAKLHGSALEYAVKLQDRYRDAAITGLGGAARVVGGSRYMVAEAASVIPGWLERAAVVNPGCDVDLFRPDRTSRNTRPIVAFVGKFIASKGVHNLLAALGLVRHQDFDVVIVGYGGFERELKELTRALRERDTESIRSIATRGEDGPLTQLLEFVDSPDVGESYFDRIANCEIEFTGRLEHGPLSELLPTVDVLVVPSVVPEAFGMVAAEAAACGVMPIVPDHSGIAEAGAAVEDAIGRPGFLTYDSADPIRGIAAAIERVLEVPLAERSAMGEKAADLARHRWSWSHVAGQLLDLATEH